MKITCQAHNVISGVASANNANQQSAATVTQSEEGLEQSRERLTADPSLTLYAGAAAFLPKLKSIVMRAGLEAAAKKNW